MLPNFQIDRCTGDIEVRPDKGIQNLSGRPVHIASHLRAVSVSVVACQVAWQIGLHSTILVGIVVPTCSTDSGTEMPLVRQIDLCQPIQTIGYNVALLELAIRLVIVRVVHDGAVLILYSHAKIITSRIIPAQTNIRIPYINLHCGGTAGRDRDRNSQSTSLNHVNLITLFYSVNIVPLFLFSERTAGWRSLPYATYPQPTQKSRTENFYPPTILVELSVIPNLDSHSLLRFYKNQTFWEKMFEITIFQQPASIANLSLHKIKHIGPPCPTYVLLRQ